jgi:hypothetical protein
MSSKSEAVSERNGPGDCHHPGHATGHQVHPGQAAALRHVAGRSRSQAEGGQ